MRPRRLMDALVTASVRTMVTVDPIGGAMDSLVIQVTVWRDDATIRARVWSDVAGDSEVRVAGSEDEVLTLVRRMIRMWVSRDDGA